MKPDKVIKIDRLLHKRVRKAAAQLGQTIQWVVDEALKTYLDELPAESTDVVGSSL